MVDFKGLHRILYDLSVGFAEADKALGAVVQAVVNIGDEYVLGEMSSLAFGVQGQCTGVALKDGRTL
jgi:sarcosine oxidase/L-pipecolate oxidase